MALTAPKLKAIECIISGENMSDVARLAKISRTALYHWMDDREFKEELNRQTQQLKTQGEQHLNSKISTYISELEKIALTGRSEKNRTDALMYLVNRTLGSPTSKVQDVTDTKEETKVSSTDLQQEFTKFKVIPSTKDKKTS